MNIPRRVRGAAALKAAFDAAHTQGRCALITYLTLGYPSPAETPCLARALQEGGADIIELGVPFSDPVADGPTIQRASYAALRSGMTPRGSMALANRLRQEGVTVPLLFMGYYNPMLNYGLDAYAGDCADSGIDGLIVPDLPLEEAGPLQEACRRYDVALIFLVAPTTPPARIARLAEATSGFLYVVSRLGTTGAELGLNADLTQYLALVRRQTQKPLALGFGISTPEQVRALASQVDGLIVGSAIVEQATRGSETLHAYVSSLRAAL